VLAPHCGHSRFRPVVLAELPPTISSQDSVSSGPSGILRLLAYSEVASYSSKVLPSTTARRSLAPAQLSAGNPYPAVAPAQGMVQGEELLQAYASGDVFMMPSESETLGFVVLEAMASALPVVAVAAGGLTDILTEPGETGARSTILMQHPSANVLAIVRLALLAGHFPTQSVVLSRWPQRTCVRSSAWQAVWRCRLVAGSILISCCVHLHAVWRRLGLSQLIMTRRLR